MNELRAALEAILFVSNEPVTVDALVEALDSDSESIAAQLADLKRFLDENVGGFTLEQTAGGWRLATRPEHEAILKKYFAKKGEGMPVQIAEVEFGNECPDFLAGKKTVLLECRGNNRWCWTR